MIKNKLLLVLLTLTFPFYGSVAQHKTDPGIQTGPIKMFISSSVKTISKHPQPSPRHISKC